MVDMKLKLWGAVAPMHRLKCGDGDGFVYDARYGVGSCHNWILDLRARAESCWLA